MDHLWAGWRANFVTAPMSQAPTGCVLCSIATSTDDEKVLVITRGSYSFVVLNLYPYTSGHLMVVPNRHLDDLTVLSEDEDREMAGFVRRAIVALRLAYSPEGFNIGMNLGRAAGAGIADHLHTHVVPRWSGDSNFMATAALTRVLPEALDVTRDRVRSAWGKV
ncbi:MAG: HIT family protein [Ferrimicrobium sp.]